MVFENLLTIFKKNLKKKKESMLSLHFSVLRVRKKKDTRTQSLALFYSQIHSYLHGIFLKYISKVWIHQGCTKIHRKLVKSIIEPIRNRNSVSHQQTEYLVRLSVLNI